MSVEIYRHLWGYTKWRLKASSIDGNHEPEYACEDGVLAFRKLKVGGTIIFDDYGWCGKEGPQPGIDAFRAAYYKRINNDHPCVDTQVFIKKTR